MTQAPPRSRPRHRRGAGEQARRCLPAPDPGRARHPRAVPARHLRRRSPPGPARHRPARDAGSTGSSPPAATAPPSSWSSSRSAPAPRWLAGLPAGARVEVTGPLGPAVRAAEGARSTCVLVGEGYAAAPLFPLAERLRERECAVTLVVAGADEAHLLSALEARRSARAVTVVTGDGSVGQPRAVADVIDEVLEQAGAEVVYAAGPPRPCTPSRPPPSRQAPGARPRSRRRCRARPGCARAAPYRSSARTASPGWCAPAPTARCSAATGCAGTTSRPLRVSVDLAGLTLPNPVLVASGCGGTGRELDGVRRTSTALGGFVTRSITVDARARRRRRRDRGDPVRPGQRGRPAEPRPRPVPRHRAAVAGAAGGPRLRLDRRPVAGGVRRAGPPARPLPGLAGIEVNLSAPDAPGTGVFDVREPFHAASVVAAVHRDLPRGMPVLAKLRSDVVRVVESARTRARRRGRRGRRRQRAARRDARRPARRAERAGDPAARAALRGRGARRGARTRRSSASGGIADAARRPRLPRRRRDRRPGRHRPAARPHHRRAGRPSWPGRYVTERTRMTVRCPRPRRHRASAARSASGSTRTPRCCAPGGSRTTSAGLERFALTAVEAVAPYVSRREAAVGVLRAVRQPRRRRAGAGDRDVARAPARWCCST